ncbi:Asp-tRNA(Asn)/Glu-tRNA(Gln) amidotransferase subunit GatA [Candidatus Parcubacteria bacterium]|uniref:Glutamyl-tRNA(Gln) amidotransferase subunit A n=1 Tax=Candidatus Kaiserbacteria bacterium CG10_big_fil_rev_8_21_14_0_10_47_16 TaxID=1974608 RepID=A0A2H0UDH0_9BACT|nr:Asp-tRNA(Asn)/Glu-tRNA(Gln) amidotransferase subunit GatA [Candidatus Parcubacteria bacterium]PIR84400.1 MAG: Asp-tRNA(Asn)/Glu-tRNA(Gln) amidotransferase GatCAB subunit A [Candidatus Kaiserbacteria bacterium CG10_big_fil_rev_8_21_14_0_10_47_16]
MTISELRKKFVEGSYTPVDALTDIQKVIDERDGTINAFVDVFDDAMASAEEATARYKTEGENAPALLGMPIAIKTNILIEGKRATASSKMLEHYVATYDATVITKLKEAGALFVGATNMDEFAMGSSTESSAFGITRNPVDESRVPGGSSGGSAAAVAMGAAVAALGTDTGGSVRQPASFCGVVGYKPTYGSVSRSGLIAMGSSLDQAGPLTNTVADAEIIHNIISGKDPLDATTINADTYPLVPLKDTYRIGVPRDFLGTGIDADVSAVFESTLTKLKEAGHEIVDVTLPLMEKGLAAYYIVMPAEVSSNLGRFDGVRYGLHVDGADLLDDYMLTRAQGFGEEVKRRILLGTYVLSAGYYDSYYGKAEQVREMMRDELDAVFKDVDILLTPTSPVPAFKIGEKSDPLSMYLADIFTVPANLTGVPALSIPAGTVDRDGVLLPVGVQCIGPHAGDARLFDFGKKMNGEL